MATLLTKYDLTNQADYFGSTGHPKLKFLWNVKFTFRTAIGNPGSDRLDQVTYHVKQSTRPSPSIQYKDVNFYNYRTKVATRSEMGVYSITFYDDPANFASRLFMGYMRQISPITDETNSKLSTNYEENDGGQFSSVGPQDEDIRYSPIDKIELFHYYNTTAPIEGKTVYRFFNPKISQMNFDELDMTSNEPSLVTMTFNCDSFSVDGE